VISAAVVAEWKMETVWKCPFCSSIVSDSCNRRRLGTSLSVDARVSELFQSVGGSKTELLLRVQGVLPERREAAEGRE